MKILVNRYKMKYKFILLMIFVVLSLSYVSSVCTVNLDKGIYSIEELATVTMSCSEADERNQAYTLTWYNGTNSQETDIRITPNVKNTPFIESFAINSTFVGTVLNATLTGTNLEGADNSTVQAAAASDLILTDFTITDEYFIGKHGAIKFVVKDSSGNAISNANCIIDVVNGDNLPILNAGGSVISQGNGYVLFSNYLSEDIFTEGLDYKWDLACTCHNSTGFTSGLPGYCFDESDGHQVYTFKHGESQYPFTIVDIEDKMIINKTVDITNTNGVWVEDENGYRVNMTASVSLLQQEDINWSVYNQSEGMTFLTAGEKFRVCMYANNTFDGAQHIKMTNLLLLKYPGHMVHPLDIDGSKIDGKEVMNIEIKEGNYEKCGDWIRVPSYIKGQNKYKINFHMQVEGYEQEFIITSDRFTIFGERTDTDYIDYLTINDVNFTKVNATEGEYVQIKANITSNHPFKNTRAKIHLVIEANKGGNERFVDLIDYNSGDQYGGHYDYERLFYSNVESIILTPRIKIPYGTIDQDAFDVFSVDFGLHILSEEHGEELWTQIWDEEPTINIVDYNIEITNVTTTISRKSASACSAYVINLTYNDIISDTNANLDKQQHFILRTCIEDTTNDYYLHCTYLEIQPDEGTDQIGSFTTTLPYTSSNIEAELDLWIYDFDENSLDLDCINCGDLVFDFSGDEGDGVFNITVNSSESCRYSKSGITIDDDNIYNQWRQTNALEESADALEGIENKTGTFHLDVDCPDEITIGREMNCLITAYVEDSQLVEKEVDFTCYIYDSVNEKRYSELNFNKMITRSSIDIEKSFHVPEDFSSKEQYILQCHADYYNLGSRRDSFYDTFTAVTMGDLISVPSDSGVIDKIKDVVDDIIDDPFKFPYIAIFISCFIMVYFVSKGVERKYTKHKEAKKQFKQKTKNI